MLPKAPTPLEILVEAAQELAAATIAYTKAQQAARDAQYKETQCQSDLIQAQKDFDKAVANVKKDAPHGGEWSNKA